MRKRLLIGVTLLLATLVATTDSAAVAAPLQASGYALEARPAYRASIVRLPEALRHRMIGTSWRRGCPVRLRDLRLIRLRYWGFDRGAHQGKLVVHERWAPKIARVFGKIYDARLPIRRMRLIEAYDGVDMRSMRADNTSAFNCRYRNGRCCVWSEHAYGRAIDIDPVENPYVGPWGVSPPNGARYADRTPLRRGMLAKRDRVWWAFHAIGWEWGGQWPWPTDYQHFSATNR